MAVAMELIRTRKSRLSMDLAPLIDVVFQLLVFFMLTSTFAQPAMKLILPKATVTDLAQKETIVISIDKQGEIFLNNRPTTFDSLKSDLQEVIKKYDDPSVHVKGDRDMPYKFFVQVMDVAKQAGATHVLIVHQGKTGR